MASGGLRIYCPGCKELSVCAAAPLRKANQPGGRRWLYTNHSDINWFRRCRVCQICEKVFITAEVEEAFLDELVVLRAKLAEKNKERVDRLRAKAPWILRKETVRLEHAKALVRASAWWLRHPSGGPARAPSHADRVAKTHLGWAVEFGANSFLVGLAIERCRLLINRFLDDIAAGKMPSIDDLNRQLELEISGAVANYEGYEYEGFYPTEDGHLVFGNQSISVRDAARFVMAEAKVDDLFL